MAGTNGVVLVPLGTKAAVFGGIVVASSAAVLTFFCFDLAAKCSGAALRFSVAVCCGRGVSPLAERVETILDSGILDSSRMQLLRSHQDLYLRHRDKSLFASMPDWIVDDCRHLYTTLLHHSFPSKTPTLILPHNNTSIKTTSLPVYNLPTSFLADIILSNQYPTEGCQKRIVTGVHGKGESDAQGSVLPIGECCIPPVVP